MPDVKCVECKVKFHVTPARVGTAKFCSYSCRGKWRSKNWVGKNNPRWTGGQRTKTCQFCGKKYGLRPCQPITSFRKQKFCSKTCSDNGGYRRKGEEHPNWKPDSRRNDRRGKHGSWARAVVSRDGATCVKCGASGVELHAHHIKSFRDYPELRWDVDNGTTLCFRCHWAEHTALTANGVNSGNILPGNAGDNPEPSSGRKPVEGVTTRGRAYRRWSGNCEWCRTFITKRWSDAIGKSHLFCSRSCAGKYKAATRTWRPMKNQQNANGGNSPRAPCPKGMI